MMFTAVTLVGMTMGQPLDADYHTMQSRNISIPIEYKKDRKSIRQVFLYVAYKGENVWYQEGVVAPDKDSFSYFAKEDGIYWFKMQIEDLKGNRDPVDLTRDPPDLKMVIDTTPPQARVTNAKRNGEEIVVEWQVEDKFPNDAATKVHFRPIDSTKSYWQEVTLPANSRTGVKFPCGTSEGITVKVSVADVAGNRTEITKDFPGTNQTTSNSSPTIPVKPIVEAGMGAGTSPTVPPPPMNLDPVGPLTPIGPSPVVPPAPVTPVTPPVTQTVTPPTIVQPPTTLITPVQPPATTTNINAHTSGAQPLAVIDPKAPPPVAALPTNGSATPTTPWNGGQPTVEVTRAQAINYPRFDLGYDLEQRGPSGISRVDLWVTRDDGKSWNKWSQHDGKGGLVRVVLDVRENTILEGNYGFRLVPVSGAGLSEREPAAGDVPEMRVVLDVTPPQIELYPPASDPNAPDSLVLQWKATDRNFGEEPITLEWSATLNGPWKPVTLAGNEPIVQVAAVNAPVAKRLANTGQFAWRVPAGVPARVYLKVTACDAAGNVKEVVTREPILVDLTKPKAKISGIVPASK